MDTTKILIIEDNPVDALCFGEALNEYAGANFEILHVETLEQALRPLAEQGLDAVVLDLGLPDSQGIETFLRVRDTGPDAPIVVLSGLNDEALAIETLRRGAQDYLVKDKWDAQIIVRSLNYAVQRHRLFAELKQANEATRRANRALLVLSECNQLLVRASEERKFLEEACKIVVDHGGYRMAWIGFAGHDKEKTVRPEAVAGLEDQYLKNVKITWSDEETGRGPTGTAIRTGKARINRNSRTDREFRPWRSEALKRGYSSSIGLPLNAGGEIVGALTIYSIEPDAFDEEEERLLGQLADDLGYGISALRTRAAKEKADLARRESEHRFRSLFEAAQDCIFLQNRSSRFTLVNPAVANLFGIPSSKMVGMSHADLFGTEDSELARDSEMRVLRGESIEGEHTRLINGTPMTFLETRTPMRDDEGNIVGIFTISRDITGRKRRDFRVSESAASYSSETMRHTMRMAEVAAKQDATILLLGESGSGKDYLARYIHDASARSAGPFFSVNCAAIASQLAESELFGHEKGAFTGAQSRKRGLLELAEGGTLVLNEIGELPLPLQSKLLTFLDTRSFLRVGGQAMIHVSARLIAATHRDLGEERNSGRFLEPLFYRLSVFPIRIPSLRERKEDLPILANKIITQLALEMQLKETPVMDSAALEVLRSYDWLGNVRELRNVLERSLILWDGGPLSVDLKGTRRQGQGWSHVVKHVPERTLQDVIEEVAHSLCEHVLELSSGNKKEAAESLGISRDTLYRYLKRMDRKRRHKRSYPTESDKSS